MTGSNRRQGRELLEEFDPLTGPASALELRDNAAASAAALSTSVLIAGVLVGLVLLVAGGGFLTIGWYENRGTPPQAGGGAWAFARLGRMTGWLRLRLSAADTPYEQAKTIGLAVPKRREEIDQLADLYVRERYGRAAVDLQQTRSMWQRIRWSFWRAGVKRRLPRWRSAPRALPKRFKH